MKTPGSNDVISSLSRRQMLRLTERQPPRPRPRRPPLLRHQPPTFRFIVINDIHCRDERCHPWFRKIVASMASHQPEFCLINGDLCENGLPDQLSAVKEIFGSLGVPLYATVGNHDYLTDTNHAPFDQIFPNSLNYHFQHAGWQFIGLDSTRGPQGLLHHHPAPHLRLARRHPPHPRPRKAHRHLHPLPPRRGRPLPSAQCRRHPQPFRSLQPPRHLQRSLARLRRAPLRARHHHQ